MTELTVDIGPTCTAIIWQTQREGQRPNDDRTKTQTEPVSLRALQEHITSRRLPTSGLLVDKENNSICGSSVPITGKNPYILRVTNISSITFITT